MALRKLGDLSALAGAKGDPGKSAYQLAVDSGAFVGSEGDWLLSLKGAKGDAGIPGTPGQDGQPGAPGATPTLVTGQVNTTAATATAMVSPTGVNANEYKIDLGIPKGDSFIARGMWASGQSYAVGDFVAFAEAGANAIYTCVQAHTSGSITPVNGSYWTKVTASVLTPSSDFLHQSGRWFQANAATFTGSIVTNVNSLTVQRTFLIPIAVSPGVTYTAMKVRVGVAGFTGSLRASIYLPGTTPTSTGALVTDLGVIRPSVVDAAGTGWVMAWTPTQALYILALTVSGSNNLTLVNATMTDNGFYGFDTSTAALGALTTNAKVVFGQTSGLTYNLLDASGESAPSSISFNASPAPVAVTTAPLIAITA